MSEWWSYSPRDLLMFSPQTYYRLLELHNAELWPAHVLALALGAAPLMLFRRDTVRAGRLALAIIALAWLSAAWLFFWQRYASINLAAPFFALLFVIEPLLLAIGLPRGRFVMSSASRRRRRAALGLYLFALYLYPCIGMIMGRSWMQAEVFGLAPDPTALATLAVLLLADRRTFWLPSAIPLLWLLISGATLWAMESPDFFLAPALALRAVIFASVEGKRRGQET